jgi:hypothetical protein
MRSYAAALFLEDLAHEWLVRSLVDRMASETGLSVTCRVFNARGGHGKTLSELEQFLTDLHKGVATGAPDIVVVAIDANCKGINKRRKEIHEHIPDVFVNITVCAIPDPHIERWMLLDSAAFKMALGEGCKAPDKKCDKDRYKMLLANAVQEAGIAPILGGLEHADSIVANMDINATMMADKSFKQFIDDLRVQFNRLKTHDLPQTPDRS